MTTDKTENVRAIVLGMLLEEEKGTEYSHILLNDVLLKYGYLPQQEKAFLKRLFEGCVERNIELDYVLNQFSKTKTAKMKPLVRNALRMAVYQILFMDSVPDSAACNEAVKLIQKRGLGGLSGFVNGVLRTIARQKDQITYPDIKTNPVMALSVRTSTPEWLVNRLIHQFGFDETSRILAETMKIQPITIRLEENLSESEQKSILEKIKGSGIVIEQHPYLSYAWMVQNAEGATQIPGFSEGKVFISDVSSMLAVEVAGIKSGDHVLDLCAAPGGKTLHAASKLNGTGMILARDLTEYKVNKIKENIVRSQYQNIVAEPQDATILTPEIVGKMDVVIVDAPCSGLGVIGKKQDIKYHASEEGIQSLAELQKRILQNASEYVKKGGTLVYSTCTVTSEENQDNRDWILKNLPFEADSIEEYLPQELKGTTGQEGYLQLLPGIHKTDGFFISKYRKI